MAIKVNPFFMQGSAQREEVTKPKASVRYLKGLGAIKVITRDSVEAYMFNYFDGDEVKLQAYDKKGGKLSTQYILNSSDLLGKEVSEIQQEMYNHINEPYDSNDIHDVYEIPAEIRIESILATKRILPTERNDVKSLGEYFSDIPYNELCIMPNVAVAIMLLEENESVYIFAPLVKDFYPKGKLLEINLYKSSIENISFVRIEDYQKEFPDMDFKEVIKDIYKEIKNYDSEKQKPSEKCETFFATFLPSLTTHTREAMMWADKWSEDLLDEEDMDNTAIEEEEVEYEFD